MVDAIHEYGFSNGGKRVSRGYYAVSPDGRVCFLHARTTIKPTWRLATEAEVAALKAGPAPAPAPAPAPVAAAPNDSSGSDAAESDADSEGRTSDADSEGRGNDNE